MSLCTGLAVYNQVKKLTTGECASVLGQNKLCSSQKGQCFNYILTFRRICEVSQGCINKEKKLITVSTVPEYKNSKLLSTPQK